MPASDGRYVVTGDDARVRRFLEAWDMDRESYREQVIERMRTLRQEHPGGDFPVRFHGVSEIGTCVECDALSVLEDGAEET